MIYKEVYKLEKLEQKIAELVLKIQQLEERISKLENGEFGTGIYVEGCTKADANYIYSNKDGE